MVEAARSWELTPYLATVCFCIIYRLQEDPPPGVSASPAENNIMLWNAIIFGFV